MSVCRNLSTTYYRQQPKFLQEIRIEGHTIERRSSTVAQQSLQIPAAGGRRAGLSATAELLVHNPFNAC